MGRGGLGMWVEVLFSEGVKRGVMPLKISESSFRHRFPSFCHGKQIAILIFFFHLDILGINSLATSDLLGEVDIRARVKIQQRCYLAARPA